MQLSHNEEDNFSLARFESMLKTNDVLFFDSNEFENIIHHYLENGKISLAKKAVKMGLAQHPTSVNLRLFKVEILVFEDKLDLADGILNELKELESSNEEIYIQKAQICSKKICTRKPSKCWKQRWRSPWKTLKSSRLSGWNTFSWKTSKMPNITL